MFQYNYACYASEIRQTWGGACPKRLKTPVLDSCQHPLIWCVRALTFWQALRRTAKLWEQHAGILQGNHNARARRRSVIKASVTSSPWVPSANGRLLARWVRGGSFLVWPVWPEVVLAMPDSNNREQRGSLMVLKVLQISEWLRDNTV